MTQPLSLTAAELATSYVLASASDGYQVPFIAVTAPYMHDGSIATLSGVLDHYAAGGRTIASGAYAGIGHDNRNKAPNGHGFILTMAQKTDVISFLESLTDSAFLHNPAFSNPWK